MPFDQEGVENRVVLSDQEGDEKRVVLPERKEVAVVGAGRFSHLVCLTSTGVVSQIRVT